MVDATHMLNYKIGDLPFTYLDLYIDGNPCKFYFHKSLLIGVNVPHYWMVEATHMLNCKIGDLPFTYLDLHIGDIIVNKILEWKPHELPMGDWFVLLKFFLFSLLVCFISLFMTSICIISKIEPLFKYFL